MTDKAVALSRFRLTKRDKAIVEDVYTHRLLTTNQIHALHFAPRGQRQHPVSSRCRKRLRILEQKGYLQRRRQPTTPEEGRKPDIFFLWKAAVNLLAVGYRLEPENILWKPRYNKLTWSNIRHQRKTNDIRVAVEVTAKWLDITVVNWLDDRSIKSREMKAQVKIVGARGNRIDALLIPDGYGHLQYRRANKELRNTHFFVEADLGSETVGTFARKIERYLALWQSGQYQAKYQTNILRVLTVTTSQRRLNNLKKRAEKLGAANWFWFTTFDTLFLDDTVLTDAIWHVAGQEKPYAIIPSEDVAYLSQHLPESRLSATKSRRKKSN